MEVKQSTLSCIWLETSCKLVRLKYKIAVKNNLYIQCAYGNAMNNLRLF
jgi:hypothetical protein